MITKTINYKPLIKVNNSYEAVSIERKIEKAETTNEPIEAVSPMLYTDEKDGVLSGTDIRTDKWDIALNAMDKITMTNITKNQETLKPVETEKGE